MQSCLGTGYPSLLALAEEKGFVILVMELLGPSIEDLLNFCQRRFSEKTVLMLLDQAVVRVRIMHDRSLIHRDVSRNIGDLLRLHSYFIS